MGQGDFGPSQAVQTAFKHRLAVGAARSTLDQADQERRILGAYPGIHLETGTATRPDVSGGEDLTLFLPVDVFGRVTASRRQGRADFASARATFRQTLLDIQADVLSAYVAYVAARRLSEAGKSSWELATRLKKAADSQYDVRSISEVQHVRASFEERKARQVAIDRTAAEEAAGRRLEGALGVERLPGDPVDWSQLLDLSIDGPQDWSGRPDIAALTASFDRADADRRASRLLQLPSLEVQLRRSPWSSDAEQYGARLQFSVPVWDDGASRASYRAANSRRESARLALEDRKKTALKEFEAAKIEYRAAASARKAYRELLAEAQSMLEKVQRGFELGGASVLDVVDARRNYNDTFEESIAAEQRLALAGVAVLNARGEILGELKQ